MKKDRHLPPGVYFQHGAYYLVKNNVWEPLGKDLPTALAKYGKTLGPKGGMVKMIEDALPFICHGKAKNTVAQYTLAAKQLKKILKDASPHQLKQEHLELIRDSFIKKPNWGNRIITVARLVFKHGKVKPNPAIGVERLPERKRDRLISEPEFWAIHGKAGPRLKIIMELHYRTGQRISDVLKIRSADLVDDGILFVQQKTGKKLIVRWTPELEAVVARAKGLHGNVRALTLLHNRRGKAPDYRTVHLQWTTACELAGVLDARPNDLRAMGLTAADDQGMNPTTLAGHTTPAMTVRYLRDRKAKLVDGPNLLDTSKKKLAK